MTTIDINEAKVIQNPLGLWLGWMLATAIGMMIGFLPAEAVADLLNLGWAKVLIPLFAGALIGFLQWIVLRSYLTHATDWITSAAVGWMAGYAVGLLVIKSLASGFGQTFIGYVIFGIIVSVIQWPVLRREIPALLPWAVANVIGWTSGFIVGQWIGGSLYLNSGLKPEISAALIAGISGLIAGAIIGAVLVWIVRQPER